MNITLDNIQTQDFDAIPIQEEWNMPEQKENRMHSIHAYPAKFPAFITTKAIEKAEEQNIHIQTVADIFCGCGTVAFETVSSGKHFWGWDINPVATLIADVKSRVYDDKQLENYFNRILKHYENLQADPTQPIYSNERIHYWFDSQHIDDLWRLHTSITSVVKVEMYKRFFLCAFSNILKPCSYWLTKSIKPQFDSKKNPKDVLATFKGQVNMMRKANLSNVEKLYGKANIKTANLLNYKITHPFVDLVVTSPPYVTSYEYADLHQLSTLWLGYTDDFKSFRQGTIGSLYHAHDYEQNVRRLNETGRDIVTQLEGQEWAKIKSVAQYYVDMQSAVRQVSKMLKPNGACVFVIGNTEYKGVKIDNAKHLAECLLEEGFCNVNVDRRKISNKILTPYRTKDGKFSKDEGKCRKIYSEEFVIFAQKQYAKRSC